MSRGRSRTAAKSKMEVFVIIVNGWKPLTIITKSSIFVVAAVLDPALVTISINDKWVSKTFLLSFRTFLKTSDFYCVRFSLSNGFHFYQIDIYALNWESLKPQQYIFFGTFYLDSVNFISLNSSINRSRNCNINHCNHQSINLLEW